MVGAKALTLSYAGHALQADAFKVVPDIERLVPKVISCTGVVVELLPKSLDVVETACILA